MAEWYYIESGQPRGPVDDEAIRVLTRRSAGSTPHPSSCSRVRRSGRRWARSRSSSAFSGARPAATAPPPRHRRRPRPRLATCPLLPGTAHPRPGYAAPPPGYGMASGYRPAVGFVTASGRTASPWWKRAVALILDAIILSIPISILTSMSGGGFERTTVDGETRFEWHGGGLFIGVIVGLLYYALLNGGSKGQTIGKMAMRIQVRDIDTGGPIGVGRGFGRQLMIYLFTFGACSRCCSTTCRPCGTSAVRRGTTRSCAAWSWTSCSEVGDHGRRVAPSSLRSLR